MTLHLAQIVNTEQLQHYVPQKHDLLQVYNCELGRNSSVGIATRYRLDGPGIESGWGLDFPHSASYT